MSKIEGKYTDLISRQAAIDLAKDLCVPTKDGTVYKHRCIDPDAIKELPSAHPSRQAVIDAVIKLFEAWYGGSILIDKETRAMLNALPSAQQWIPVSSGTMPEDGIYVLVTVEGWDNGKMFERAVDLALRNECGGYIGEFDTYNDWIEYGEWKVTAWMPLPDPYRKEEEDG